MAIGNQLNIFLNGKLVGSLFDTSPITFVLSLATDLAKKIPNALKDAIHIVNPSLPPSAKILAERLQQFILSTTTKTIKRLTAPN